MKSLCAFVRNPTRDEDLRRVMEEGKMAVTRTGAEPEPEPREDVQAAIEAICARAEGQLFLETGAGFELDLSQADLRGVSLWEPNLAGAFLAGADFTGSTLVRPNFFGTWLGGRSQGAAHGLRGLDLSGSDLSGAALFEVDLTGTDLSGAKLTGAILTGANLSGTHFVGDLGEVVMGLTQQQLDSARADPGNDPYLEGVRDAVTGKQLVWRGKTLDLEPHPNPPEIPDD